MSYCLKTCHETSFYPSVSFKELVGNLGSPVPLRITDRILCPFFMYLVWNREKTLKFLKIITLQFVCPSQFVSLRSFVMWHTNKCWQTWSLPWSIWSNHTLWWILSCCFFSLWWFLSNRCQLVNLQHFVVMSLCMTMKNTHYTVIMSKYNCVFAL